MHFVRDTLYFGFMTEEQDEDETSWITSRYQILVQQRRFAIVVRTVIGILAADFQPLGTRIHRLANDD